MKCNNRMILTQVILMYLAHLPIYIGLVLFNTNDTLEKGIAILFLIGIILTILVLPFCLASAIIAIVNIFRKTNNLTKPVMRYKIVLIPWFVMNFYFCALTIAGLLNPFLFLLAPIVAAIEISIAYLLMATISLFDLSFIINRKIKKEVEIKTSLVLSIIMLFIFCLDVIGSILLYCKYKDLE